MRYLINCSGSKNQDSRNKVSSNIHELSFNHELLNFRELIIQKSGIKLDWQKCLPAWQLYAGRLYKQISEENWIKQGSDIYILSALFGWIRHTDLIPFYDLSMNQPKHKIDGKFVYRIWQEFSILDKFIDSKNDIDLLTQPYRKAIHNQITPVALLPNIKFNDNYGTHKGKWLNSQLKLEN